MDGDSENSWTSHNSSVPWESAKAQVYGPFRVILRQGTDITPSSPLRQAILAVLLEARGQSKSRRSLQEMFWGSATRAKSAANLRTAIYLLKRDLAALGDNAIKADRNVLSLAPNRISLERRGTTGAQYLEGMDLELQDCEGFEDWLREKRCGPELINKPVFTKIGVSSGVLSSPSRHLALGFLPTVHAGLKNADLVRANSLLDTIARSVSHTTKLDIHDLRGFDVETLPLPIETGTGPTHFLQPLVERRGGRLHLTLRLQEVETRRIAWVSEPFDASNAASEDHAAVATEELLEHLVASKVSSDAPDLFPLTAITALFSLNDELICRTEKQIERMIEAGAPKVFECLRLFAQVFKENEGVEVASYFAPETLCELVAEVPNSNPMLPLWHSLAGYSAHMLLGENDLAERFLQSSYARAPNLALNLDHLAVLRLVQGDLAGAETAFQRCQKVGASSPWRYTYDVTGSMLAMARGDYRSSLMFANHALMRKPRFIGALRYAMAGFALSGNTRDADRMKTRIHRLRPGYDMAAWTESMVRRTPNELGRKLVKTFEQNGFV